MNSADIVASPRRRANTGTLTACLLAALACAAAANRAAADGVTAYLPLNLEPEVERQIERVLILAQEPILKRPSRSTWFSSRSPPPASATTRCA